MNIFFDIVVKRLWNAIKRVFRRNLFTNKLKPSRLRNARRNIVKLWRHHFHMNARFPNHDYDTSNSSKQMKQRGGLQGQLIIINQQLLSSVPSSVFFQQKIVQWILQFGVVFFFCVAMEPMSRWTTNAPTQPSTITNSTYQVFSK